MCSHKHGYTNRTKCRIMLFHLGAKLIASLSLLSLKYELGFDPRVWFGYCCVVCGKTFCDGSKSIKAKPMNSVKVVYCYRIRCDIHPNASSKYEVDWTQEINVHFSLIDACFYCSFESKSMISPTITAIDSPNGPFEGTFQQWQRLSQYL